MTPSLSRALLEAHAPAPPARGAPLRRLRVRPDHVLLGESQATLTLAAFERSARRRVTVEWALLCADRRPLDPGFEMADVRVPLQERSLAAGIHFAAPGSGSSPRLYQTHAAAPGKLVACAGEIAWTAGAFGAMAIAVDAVEAAIALCGAPLETEWTGSFRVRLEGLPAHATGGDDVALAIAAAGRLVPGAVLEVTGPGVRSLSTGDRLRVAGAASWLGLSSALFPSDETTHAALRALGRAADWKAIAAEDDEGTGSGPAWSLRLEDIEPMMAPARDPRDARRVIGSSGTPVAAVWFGRRSTLEDVRRFCSLLGGRRVAEGVQAWLEPDSRAFLEACEESGWIAALEHAGVRIGMPPARLLETPGAGLLLSTGVDPREAGGTFVASPWTCALAAREGTLRDPREAASDAGPAPDFATGAGDGRLHTAPRAAAENGNGEPGNGEARDRTRGFPLAAPLDGPLRGMLLLRTETLPVSRILPWGARRVPEEGDVAAFARHAFSTDDPGFAERARDAGAGFVAARGELGGGGGEGERAALALAALGVRATLAGSYDPAFRARLVRSGVLPLRMVRPADLDAFAAGDELEVPPATLDVDTPLAVRNLTRGIQSIVRHDLDESALECVIAGGLLASVMSEEVAP